MNKVLRVCILIIVELLEIFALSYVGFLKPNMFTLGIFISLGISIFVSTILIILTFLDIWDSY
jgi:hypothetical protein